MGIPFIYISQFFGFIALIFLICSIQSNKKKNILVYQVIANLFFGVQYLLLNTLSAATMNIIGIARCIVYYYYEKKNKNAPEMILILFFIIIVIASIFTSTGLISILPIVATLLYTYGIWQNNLKKYRIIVVVGSLAWLAFNIFVGAYVAIISSILELTSGIVAIYRHDIKSNNS